MKLSIIVPVYNTAPWLKRCMDSVLKPDCGPEVEIVAVNDGSTDDSRAILAEYEGRFPELVRVIDTPNGGLGHARNTGVEAARGDWLLFLDSDDWLSANAVQEMMTVLNAAAETDDIVVFDLKHVDGEGRELQYFRGTEREEPFHFADFPAFLFSPHNAVNKLWRRELFTGTGIRFPDRLWFEDLATMPRLYLHARGVIPVHSAWYCYYQRPGSIMLSASKAERNLEMLSVEDLVLDHYRAEGAFERFRTELEYKFWYEAYLASVTRVNRIDARSPVQATLRDDYIRRFPDYRNNPYVRAASPKLHLLDREIRLGRWAIVRAMISLNNKSKGR